jgi:hypothetical protein
MVQPWGKDWLGLKLFLKISQIEMQIEPKILEQIQDNV